MRLDGVLVGVRDQVFRGRVAWDGPQAGSQSLEANKDGKIDERLGELGAPSVTLTITEVRLEGYVYRPELGAAPPSIVVDGPA